MHLQKSLTQRENKKVQKTNDLASIFYFWKQQPHRCISSYQVDTIGSTSLGSVFQKQSLRGRFRLQTTWLVVRVLARLRMHRCNLSLSVDFYALTHVYVCTSVHTLFPVPPSRWASSLPPCVTSHTAHSFFALAFLFQILSIFIFFVFLLSLSVPTKKPKATASRRSYLTFMFVFSKNKKS